MRRATLVLALVVLAAVAGTACRSEPRAPEPVAVTVTKRGFEPWKIPARAGQPLVLVVTRTTDETCATDIVIPEANVNVPLPLAQPVRIELTPARSGQMRFSCAHHQMFQGVIDVE